MPWQSKVMGSNPDLGMASFFACAAADDQRSVAKGLVVAGVSVAL
jgi:hypothetical protein